MSKIKIVSTLIAAMLIALLPIYVAPYLITVSFIFTCSIVLQLLIEWIVSLF